MELLSVTNKKTQLHKSPSDLSVACTQEHNQKRTVSSDISVFPGYAASNCFVQINKSDLVEIWRIKSSSDGNQILERLRKTKADGIQAVSCGKNNETTPVYAIGFTTGQIKVIELNSKSTCRVEFPADPNCKASVVSLDFSSCGGYLSSVLENGIINIYGLTTKVKSDHITFDKESTLARFHPGKRFQLAVASYNGCVTIYDIGTKRISFQERNAHEAPCRDLAMPEDIPNRLLSCGCDSVIKIFDTRKKSTGLQIQSYCGFSTIAVTKCGGLFAVGNLKGDLLTYDMRNLRQPLAKMKVDDELITRVAFVPNTNDSADYENLSLSIARYSDELPEPPPIQSDFTMDDVIGFQQGRVSDFDMTCSSRVSAITARADTQRRTSETYAQKWGNALNDLSFSTESFDTAPSDSPDGRRSDQIKGRKESLVKRRSSFKPLPLQLIREECGDKENLSSSINVGTPNGTGGPRFSSTPTPLIRLTEATDSPSENSEDVIDVDAIESPPRKETNNSTNNKESATIVASSSINTQTNLDLKKEFENIHEKIRFEVQSLGLDLSMRHFEALTHAYEQRRQIEHRMKTIEECVGLLMNDDVKINRIMELQDENRELKQQLSDFTQTLNLNKS